ncbi:hypothetical protein G6F37_008386 [Rhizopus arrhizus]|nr:hypothetical protein G6F38_007346 [Rhizopus arrhizus]KAG1155611.1 hypothetical protein G6F37_008386 [Rhizopus arrhizus]
MQQRLQSSAQPSVGLQTPPNTSMEEEETLSALHSLTVRLSYSGSLSPFLSKTLSLDSSLFPTTMLNDDKRRKTIDRYPNVENLQYQILDTIPSASRKMNKYQSKQNMPLKRLQYLLSGVFCLGKEVLGKI